MTRWLRNNRLLKSLSRALTAALVTSSFVLLPSVAEVALAVQADGSDSVEDYSVVLSSSENRTLAPSANDLSLPVGTGPYTIQLWVKPGANMVGSSGRVLINMEKKYAIVNDGGKWAYYIGNGTNWSTIQNSGYEIVASRWTHLALVMTNNDAHFYVDGNLVQSMGSRFDSGTGTSVPYGAIGGWVSSEIESRRFDGQVDEVKIWTSDRSASIATDMHLRQVGASGLAHYWDFNEGSGTTIHDRAGSINLIGTTSVFSDVKQVTSVAGGDTIVSFPRTYLPGVGGWKVPTHSTNVRALAVAGGGGGGGTHAGGGGGGEVAVFESIDLTSISNIRVGQGGLGFSRAGIPDCTANKDAFSGQNTVIGSVTLSGGGAGINGCGDRVAGDQNGGSGGGSPYPGTPAGSSTKNSSTANVTFYGNAGGVGATWGASLGEVGGGGGGATSAGEAGIQNTRAGNGGAGLGSSITGTVVCYGAGGGGGARQVPSGLTTASTGGSCSGTDPSGGAGSIGSTPGGDGLVGTGSGGGGGGVYESGGSRLAAAAGDGGSGVIILRYTPVKDLAWSKTSLSQSYAATNSQVVPSSGTWTFEAWVLPASEALSGSQIFGIFTQQDDSDTEANRAGLWVQGGAIGYNYGGTAYTRSPVALASEQWYHLALAVTANSQKVYVNGQLFHSSAYSELTIGGNFALGGLRQSNFLDWPGQIDQVKVWGVELNQSQIEASMHTYSTSPSTPTANCSNGLRAHYDFNDYQEGQVLDRTGCGRDLAYNKAVAGSYAQSDLTESGIVQSGSVGGSNVYLKFNRSYLTATGGWTPATGVISFSALVVGGGGAGGFGADYGAGGGGGGEVVEQTSLLTAGLQTVKIQVGQGGIARPSGNPANSATYPTSGQASTVSFSRMVQALPGGEGGSGHAGISPYFVNATSGNFTGGGGAAHASRTAAPGNGSGFDGGYGNPNGSDGNKQTGGGGAGAGQNGLNGSNTVAGAGGAGVLSSITGETYGGGGGGGKRTSQGSASSGGLGGGGQGGLGGNGVSGAVNSGGGGGGGGGTPITFGGNGGSGVVVLSYSLAPDAPTSLAATQSTSHATVVLNWTAPTYVGNSGITDYAIEYKPAGGNWTSYSDGVSTATNASLELPTQCVAHEFRVFAKNSSFISAASATVSATPVWGTFGSLSGVHLSSTNSECVVKFTSTASSTTWTPPAGVDKIRALVVGGGGGGGAWVGAGGGAGGMTESSNVNVSGQTVTIAVGSGGLGGKLISGVATTGGNGEASAISALGQPILSVSGGGRGAGWAAGQSPGLGGSGGGGNGYGNANANWAGASGISGQGNQGGNGEPSTQWATGGGGGAGGAGGTGAGFYAGDGGIGAQSSITGVNTYYAGGGGGGYHGNNAGSPVYYSISTGAASNSAGTGGLGGGGDGGQPTSYAANETVYGQNGVSGTGGGGGGAGKAGDKSSIGGNGGSGIIVLRQLSVAAPSISSHPLAQSVQPGATANFSVTASAIGTLSYQWQTSTDGTNWTNVGSNSSSFTTGTLSLSDDGNQYRVTVTNTLNGQTSSATSSVATLSVTGVTLTVGACTAMVGSDTGVTISETANGACLVEYTNPGNNSFYVPNLVSSLQAFIVGGGGGGGGAKLGQGGGGGGGGAASRVVTLAVTSSQVIPVIIGAGGAGGAANNNGQNGGTTSISSSYSVPGGNAGKAPTSWPGGAGEGGTGASSLYASSGGSGGNGVTDPGDRSYYQPKFGNAGSSRTFAGEFWCVGGGGGGGNREVSNDVYFQWEPRSQYCSDGVTKSGGSGGWHNGTTNVLATRGLANRGGGGGGGSYNSSTSTVRSGASGADGIVAIYFVPGTGDIALSSVNAASYSGTTHAITLTKDNPTSTVTWTTSNAAVCTVTGNASSATVTEVAAGLCEVSVVIAANSPYARGSAATSFQIDKISRTAPTWINGSVSVPFGSTLDLRPKLTSPGSNSYTFSTSGTANSCAVTGYTLNVGNVGDTCNVTPTLLGTSTYLDMVGTQLLSVTVTKISQSALVITSARSMNVNQTLTVSAAGGSGAGALSYHIADQGSTNCSVNSSTGALTASAAGDCEVYAQRASSTNYDAVTSSHVVVAVNKISQSLTWVSQPQAQYVSGNTYALEATASSQLTVAYSISAGLCSVSGSTVTFTGSGDCVIQAGQAGNGSYFGAVTISQTVSVGKINQTMTFSAIANKSWGSLAFSLSATASSALNITYSESNQTTADACDVSATGIVTIKNVGTCAVTATQAGDSSYTPVNVTRLFNVTANQAGAPFIGSVSFGDRQLNASFFTPSYLGGGTVAAYEMRAYELDGTLASTNTGCIANAGATQSCSVTGLDNGKKYVLRIAAITQAGLGQLSASSSEIIPASNPEAVGNLIAIEGNGTLSLQWTQPTSFGGGSFFQYRIYWRAPGQQYQADGSPGASVGSATSTSFVITGLTNGVAYDVKIVTATSNNNVELQSNTAEVRQTPFTVPDAPAAVVALDNNSNVIVAWQPPVFDGGNPIDQYVVTQDGSTVCTITSAASTSCEVAKPAAGSSSLIEVKAGNDAGLSVAASTSISVLALQNNIPQVSVGGGSGSTPGTLAPLIQGVSGSSKVSTNELLKLTGTNLDLVQKVLIGATEASFFINSEGLITIRIPVSLTVSNPSITLIGTFGSRTFTNLIEIQTASLPQDTKITVGTFQGFAAVYTKNYEGKRLSIRIGDKWRVIPELRANYTYNLTKVGAGKTVTVMVYVDRVLQLVQQVRVQ